MPGARQGPTYFRGSATAALVLPDRLEWRAVGRLRLRGFGNKKAISVGGFGSGVGYAITGGLFIIFRRQD
jgi:hypothetical protein